MAKKNKTEKISFVVDMEIVLPDGETKVSQKEKNAIAHKIFDYLTQIGTTSDSYEGHLKGELKNGEWKYALSVVDKPIKNKYKIKWESGHITICYDLGDPNIVENFKKREVNKIANLSEGQSVTFTDGNEIITVTVVRD